MNEMLKNDWSAVELGFHYGEAAQILNCVITDGITLNAAKVVSAKNAVRINRELQRRVCRNSVSTCNIYDIFRSFTCKCCHWH